MAPIKPTALPPTAVPRPEARGPARAGPLAGRDPGTFPAPQRTVSLSATAVAQGVQNPASAASAGGGTSAAVATGGATPGNAHDTRQLFTLQTLSTFAGVIVGATDPAPSAGPSGPVQPAAASAAQADEGAPTRRPARPGSQIDIKV